MCILKNKIRLLKQRRSIKPDQRSAEEQKISNKVIQKTSLSSYFSKKDVDSELKLMKLKYKNMYKNYGRAICTFILSQAAQNYLELTTAEYYMDLHSFLSFVREKKRSLDGIHELRALLLPALEDNNMVIIYKKAFKKMAEIFIKYFSVNWIYHSKLEYKLDYIKFRYKMLRKIMNPTLL